MLLPGSLALSVPPFGVLPLPESFPCAKHPENEKKGLSFACDKDNVDGNSKTNDNTGIWICNNDAIDNAQCEYK